MRLAAAAAVIASVAVAVPAASARDAAPLLADVSVETGGPPFAGDRRLLATVSPNSADRAVAVVRFALKSVATVKVEAVRKGRDTKDVVVWSASQRVGAGRHSFRWRPELTIEPGTYLMRITVVRAGLKRVYGARRPTATSLSRAPVVRVLGVEATFTSRSYAPGEMAPLRVAVDAQAVSVQIYRSGDELENTNRNDEMKGIAVGAPVSYDWALHRNHPRALAVQLDASWPSGVYFARLTTDDGRLGFAPFILRAAGAGASRVAIDLPTNTWQAYNFRDVDGDGWGDTWYAGGSPPVVLDRAYLNRGVPPRFRRYDLSFLRWLNWTNKRPDFFADDDLARFTSGDELRAKYDLVIFPGHSEYTTAYAYDVIERFRDRGGNLVFLSANNFFWRVDQKGNQIRRIAQWRNLNRPEASLIGSQYRANDDGTRQGVYYVSNTAAAPWLWEGTGLADGSTLGEFVGGYGIEIDATTKDSPPGTQVLAVIPNLFGLGIHGEMTYYEAPSGARVFAAGALDFGGSATFWPVRRMLENLWRELSVPRVATAAK